MRTIRRLAVIATIALSPATAFADVVELNHYRNWHVLGRIEADGISRCQLTGTVPSVAGALINIWHISGQTTGMLALSQDAWNAPNGTKTSATFAFNGANNYKDLVIPMNGIGKSLFAKISSNELGQILSTLYFKILFEGTEAPWETLSIDLDANSDFTRCLRAQKHTQPF